VVKYRKEKKDGAEKHLEGDEGSRRYGQSGVWEKRDILQGPTTPPLLFLLSPFLDLTFGLYLAMNGADMASSTSDVCVSRFTRIQ
jgi:hypothetical protein